MPTKQTDVRLFVKLPNGEEVEVKGVVDLDVSNWAPAQQERPVSGQIIVLTEDTEGQEYRSGDLVKVVNSEPLEGDEYDISVEGPDQSVSLDYARLGGFFLADEYEERRYKESVKFYSAGREPFNYTVGDIVRILDGNSGGCRRRTGDLGEITQLTGSGAFYVTVNKDHDHQAGYLNEDDVEIIAFAENRFK